MDKKTTTLLINALETAVAQCQEYSDNEYIIGLGMSFTNSEMQDLIAVARQKMNVVTTKQYLVWNPEKISIHTGLPSETLDQLLIAESVSGSSWSSVVSTDDIDSVIQAVMNEADVTLCFVEKSPEA